MRGTVLGARGSALSFVHGLKAALVRRRLVRPALLCASVPVFVFVLGMVPGVHPQDVLTTLLLSLLLLLVGSTLSFMAALLLDRAALRYRDWAFCEAMFWGWFATSGEPLLAPTASFLYSVGKAGCLVYGCCQVTRLRTGWILPAGECCLSALAVIGWSVAVRSGVAVAGASLALLVGHSTLRLASVRLRHPALAGSQDTGAARAENLPRDTIQVKET